MQTGLLLKELRECSLYACLALLVQIHYLGSNMGLPLVPFWANNQTGEIPFLTYRNSGSDSSFLMVAILIAIVLGLHQTMWESWRQTTLFLLHRPVERSQIFLNKLLAGSLLLAAVTILPMLVYALWAAKPGTHASPFYWSMTDPWWRSIGMAFACYLGAFLTGIRPARWLGSRTFPLLSILAVGTFLRYSGMIAPFYYFGLLILIGCSLISILDTAQKREFP